MNKESQLQDLLRYVRRANDHKLNVDEKLDADGLASLLLDEVPSLIGPALTYLQEQNEDICVNYLKRLGTEKHLYDMWHPKTLSN